MSSKYKVKSYAVRSLLVAGAAALTMGAAPAAHASKPSQKPMSSHPIRMGSIKLPGGGSGPIVMGMFKPPAKGGSGHIRMGMFKPPSGHGHIVMGKMKPPSEGHKLKMGRISIRSKKA